MSAYTKVVLGAVFSIVAMTALAFNHSSVYGPFLGIATPYNDLLVDYFAAMAAANMVSMLMVAGLAVGALLSFAGVASADSGAGALRGGAKLGAVAGALGIVIGGGVLAYGAFGLSNMLNVLATSRTAPTPAELMSGLAMVSKPYVSACLLLTVGQLLLSSAWAVGLRGLPKGARTSSLPWLPVLSCVLIALCYIGACLQSNAQISQLMEAYGGAVKRPTDLVKPLQGMIIFSGLTGLLFMLYGGTAAVAAVTLPAPAEDEGEGQAEEQAGVSRRINLVFVTWLAVMGLYGLFQWVGPQRTRRKIQLLSTPNRPDSMTLKDVQDDLVKRGPALIPTLIEEMKLPIPMGHRAISNAYYGRCRQVIALIYKNSEGSSAKNALLAGLEDRSRWIRYHLALVAVDKEETRPQGLKVMEGLLKDGGYYAYKFCLETASDRSLDWRDPLRTRVTILAPIFLNAALDHESGQLDRPMRDLLRYSDTGVLAVCFERMTSKTLPRAPNSIFVALTKHRKELDEAQRKTVRAFAERVLKDPRCQSAHKSAGEALGVFKN
jgi:hypothetical protein